MQICRVSTLLGYELALCLVTVVSGRTPAAFLRAMAKFPWSVLCRGQSDEKLAGQPGVGGAVAAGCLRFYIKILYFLYTFMTFWQVLQNEVCCVLAAGKRSFQERKAIASNSAFWWTERQRGATPTLPSAHSQVSATTFWLRGIDIKEHRAPRTWVALVNSVK